MRKQFVSWLHGVPFRPFSTRSVESNEEADVVDIADRRYWPFSTRSVESNEEAADEHPEARAEFVFQYSFCRVE